MSRYLLHGAPVPVRLPVGGTDRLHHVYTGGHAGAVGRPGGVHQALRPPVTDDAGAGVAGPVVDCSQVTLSHAALLLCSGGSTST